MAVAVLRPGSVTDCTGSVFGLPGDSTGWLTWVVWAQDHLGAGPFASETTLAGSPEGVPLWEPHFVTWTVFFVPLWAAARVVGAVCAYNLSIMAGLVGSGLAMFGLVRWLTARFPVALLAGAAFAFSPFAQAKATGHLNYVHLWVFPLVLWAALLLWRQPSWRRAAGLGLLVGLSGYVDGYWLLVMPLFAGSLLAVWLVAGGGAPDAGADAAPAVPTARQRVGLAAVAAGSALVVLVPVGAVRLTSGDAIDDVVERSEVEIEAYSARPWEYVLPARDHPVWDGVVGDWQDRHLHGSNFSEQTLYLGAPALAGAAAFAVLALRRRRTGRSGHATGLAVDPRLLALGLVTAAVVAIAMSFPPVWRVAGWEVPLPSKAVASLAPLWRALGRFAVPASAALVVLAAAGLAQALRRARRPAVVLVAVTALVAFDFLGAGWSGRRWSYARYATEAHGWLARHAEGAPVAEYPLWEDTPEGWHLYYLTYQQVHEHPLLNGARWNTDFGRLTAGLGGLADPQTLPALRALGIELVATHPSLYREPLDPDGHPPGLRELLPSANMALYEVAPGPRGTAALGVGRRGWYAMEHDGWASRRWMGQDGHLEVYRLDGSGGPACAGFSARSPGRPRTLTVTQDGRLLWEGVVGGPGRNGRAAADVRFVAEPDRPVTVSAEPGPLPRDDAGGRFVSVEVTDLVASGDPGDCDGA